MRVFLTELKRAFGSWGFAAAVAGAVIAALLGGWDFIGQALKGGALENVGEVSVQTAYGAMYSSTFLLLLPILCTLPYTAAFAEDLQSRFLREYLPRAGRGPYLASKTAATALSGGLALLVGLVLVLLICTMMFPPIGIKLESGQYGFTYGIYFLGVLLVTLGGFLWALVGGIAAAALKNRYMGYAVPFILYYVLSSFQVRYFKKQYAFSPREWIYPGHIELPVAFACALVAMAAAGIAYYLLMKRRLRDV